MNYFDEVKTWVKDESVVPLNEQKENPEFFEDLIKELRKQKFDFIGYYKYSFEFGGKFKGYDILFYNSSSEDDIYRAQIAPQESIDSLKAATESVTVTIKKGNQLLYEKEVSNN